MKKVCILISFICVALISCEGDIHQIIKNKDEIATLAKNKDIVYEKERGFYVLTTYKSDNNQENEYFFNKGEDGVYTLFRDSIEFRPNDVININSNDNNYQTKLCDYYLKVTQTLESYNIKELLGRKYRNHPDLEFVIYLNDGNIIEYRSGISESEDMDLKEYKEIDQGWFLYKGKP